MLNLALLPLLLMFAGGLFLLASWIVQFNKQPHLSSDRRLSIVFGLGCGAIAALLVLVVEEDKLLVEPSGELGTIEAHVRYAIERKAFLTRQLAAVARERRRLASEPTGAQQVAKINAQTESIAAAVAPIIREAQQAQRVEQAALVAQNPVLAPTHGDQLAEAYRREADRIERVEKLRRMAAPIDAEHANEFKRLQQIEQAIQAMQR